MTERDAETTETDQETAQLAPRPDDERYQSFHNKGRWQGLPLRVEDTGDRPRFEPVFSPQYSALSTQHSILMYGVPNEGMMAGQPTNVFVIGHLDDPRRRLTLVDAGSVESQAALLAALDGADVDPGRIERIVLTHCHPDHVGNAQAIQQATGATVYAHPREREQIARWGEGLRVDVWLDEHQTIPGDGFELQTIFTPGHSPGHVCVVEPASRVLLAGDMISGFGSVGIFPPHGSMREYVDSLRTLFAAHHARPFALVCPGHGPIVEDAGAKIEEYITHRLAREEEVFEAILAGAGTIDTMLPIVYPDVLPHLSFAARSTLQAHLDKLVEDGRVRQTDAESYAAT